jgi:hypothetical protein
MLAALHSSPVHRPNEPGPHRRPAARHDAAPETFPGRRPSTLMVAVLGRQGPRWLRRGTQRSGFSARLRSKADEQGGDRPVQAAAKPGRSAASLPLSPRASPRPRGVFHPRRASTRRAPAGRRRDARAIRPEPTVSSPRCERRCSGTPAGTPSSRKPGLGRLLRLSLPLSRPASCRRRSAYLSLLSETVGRQDLSSCTASSDRAIAALVATRRPPAPLPDAGNPLREVTDGRRG